jgi:pantothenate kinase-related protein Tda10
MLQKSEGKYEEHDVPWFVGFSGPGCLKSNVELNLASHLTHDYMAKFYRKNVQLLEFLQCLRKGRSFKYHLNRKCFKLEME